MISTCFFSSGKLPTVKRGRRHSREFEDLEINSSTGKFRPRLPEITASCTRARGSSFLQMRLQERAHTWIGQPEAISSVRRDKKSPDDQHTELLLFLAGKPTDIKASSINSQLAKEDSDRKGEEGAPKSPRSSEKLLKFRAVWDNNFQNADTMVTRQMSPFLTRRRANSMSALKWRSNHKSGANETLDLKLNNSPNLSPRLQTKATD